MANQLQGKVALITGAGSGIGRASALIFAREGAKVVVVDVNVAGSEETVQLVKAAGGTAMCVKADVGSAADVEAMVNTTVATYGRLDCAYNNAGIEGKQASVLDDTEENWERVLRINLIGVWLCMKYEIAQMRKQGNGAIVNTASDAGLLGVPRMGAYVASKHGVVGITKSAALECAKTGIRVNAVCPGVIQTPMIERVTGLRPGMVERMIAGEPVGRAGKPEEIGEAAAWLCSDAASFVTGFAMSVDGGIAAQ